MRRGRKRRQKVVCEVNATPPSNGVTCLNLAFTLNGIHLYEMLSPNCSDYVGLLLLSDTYNTTQPILPVRI